jgi:truncated hemoglobin YjbI
MATTLNRPVVTGQSRKVDPTAIEEVAKILGLTVDKIAKVTAEKTIRAFNSNVRENVRLARFFDREFKLPQSFSADTDKAIERFLKVTENFEITRVEEQRKLLAALGEELIDHSVQAMENSIKGIPLSEERQAQVAERLDAYRKFLTSNILTNVKKWEQVYGKQ